MVLAHLLLKMLSLLVVELVDALDWSPVNKTRDEPVLFDVRATRLFTPISIAAMRAGLISLCTSSCS